MKMRFLRAAVLSLGVSALALFGALVNLSAPVVLGLGSAVLLAGLIPSWLRTGGRTKGVRTKVALPGPDRQVVRVVSVLPLVIGLSALSRTLALVSLVGLALTLIGTIDLKGRVLEGSTVLLLAAIAYWLITFGREAPVQAATGCTVALLVLAVKSRRLPREVVFEAVMRSLALYCIASIAGYYLLGLRSSAAAGRIGGLDSTFGLLNARVFFPLASSLVIPPILASGYLVFGLTRVLSRRHTSLFHTVGCAAAVFVLLAANYRVPLLACIALLVVGALRPGLLRAGAVPLSILLLLLPFWWNDGRNAARQAVDTVAQEASGILVREKVGGARERATLNGRTYIWREARNIFDNAPVTKQALGWGYQGNVKSGASDRFFIFVPNLLSSASGISAHNTALQTLLDTGVVGLVVLMGLIIAALVGARRWIDRPSAGSLPASPLPVLLALLLSAGTEVSLAPSIGSEVFWVFVLVAMVALTGPAPARDEEVVAGSPEMVST